LCDQLTKVDQVPFVFFRDEDGLGINRVHRMTGKM